MFFKFFFFFFGNATRANVAYKASALMLHPLMHIVFYTFLHFKKKCLTNCKKHCMILTLEDNKKSKRVSRQTFLLLSKDLLNGSISK